MGMRRSSGSGVRDVGRPSDWACCSCSCSRSSFSSAATVSVGRLVEEEGEEGSSEPRSAASASALIRLPALPILETRSRWCFFFVCCRRCSSCSCSSSSRRGQDAAVEVCCISPHFLAPDHALRLSTQIRRPGFQRISSSSCFRRLRLRSTTLARTASGFSNLCGSWSWSLGGGETAPAGPACGSSSEPEVSHSRRRHSGTSTGRGRGGCGSAAVAAAEGEDDAWGSGGDEEGGFGGERGLEDGSKAQSFRTTSRICRFASRIIASRVSCALLLLLLLVVVVSEGRGLRWKEKTEEGPAAGGLGVSMRGSKGGKGIGDGFDKDHRSPGRAEARRTLAEKKGVEDGDGGEEEGQKARMIGSDVMRRRRDIRRR